MPPFTDLDRLRANLDALRPLAPEQEARVLQKFRLERNYNSNDIEGNSLLHGLPAAGRPGRDYLALPCYAVLAGADATCSASAGGAGAGVQLTRGGRAQIQC